MANKVKEVVIPREKAIFWLDKNGRWHNASGRFRHKKIIDYFHACIQRDEQGYYLRQENENYTEKVYFSYEDQALFVFDVVRDKGIILILNTKKQVKLKPQDLFVKDDSLYMQMGSETIKFAEQGLMKFAEFLEDENGQLYIRYNERRYKIPTR
jgi:hypothetical protein